MLQREKNGLKWWVFANMAAFPELVHGFSTRRGGVSGGIYSSLNLSTSTGDAEANVQENFRRFCAVLGVPPERVVKGWLVHGRDFAVVTEAHLGRRMPQRDILLTNRPSVPLFMTFADCVPIILYDQEHQAVALVHAGWRGTALRIAAAAVHAMTTQFSSRPGAIIAGIGPSIGPDHYAVGEEVIANIEAAHRRPELLWQRRNGHFFLNLWAANAQQLTDVGVGNVEIAGLCTACHLEDFYSHRAERGRTGRLGALVMLTKETFH